MARTARWWGVFLLVQVVLALGVLEVGLRLARPHHDLLRALLYSPTIATEYDEIATTEELLATTVLGFSPYREHAGYVLSSRGLRTPETPDTPRPGTLRLVVLGDSFAFSSGGVPWSWMWTTRMEARLGDLVEPPVEVVNLGVPAVGPRFELRLWELEGVHLSPDLVLLAFFIGNDFTDETGKPLRATREETLADWSQTYRLARNLYRLHRERRRSGGSAVPLAGGRHEQGGYELPGSLDGYAPPPPWFSEEGYLNLEWARLRLCRLSLRAEFEELLAGVAPVLVRLHQSVRGHGADLAVVMIPDEVQVDDDLFQRVLVRHRIPPEDVELDYPQRRLGELLQAEGIPYLDLLAELRRQGRGTSLYNLRDSHWNVEGNRLAGDLIAELLAEAGLPRGSRRKNSREK